MIGGISTLTCCVRQHIIKVVIDWLQLSFQNQRLRVPISPGTKVPEKSTVSNSGAFSFVLKVAQKLHKAISAQLLKIRKTLENAVFSRVLYGDSSGIRTLDSLIKSLKNVIFIFQKCP